MKQATNEVSEDLPLFVWYGLIILTNYYYLQMLLFNGIAVLTIINVLLVFVYG